MYAVFLKPSSIDVWSKVRKSKEESATLCCGAARHSPQCRQRRTLHGRIESATARQGRDYKGTPPVDEAMSVHFSPF